MTHFWRWPDGLVWQWTKELTVGSRRKRFELFLKLIKPKKKTTILDVGASVAATGERAENFLEEWYAHPEQIMALLRGDVAAFATRYPRVRTVTGTALAMPFDDQEFDVVFTNAVIEHVGGRAAQKQFVRECLRVGRRVFLATPSRTFPIESHTLIPFVHWLPTFWRNAIYNFLGRSNEARPDALILLTPRSLRKLFPKEARVKIVRQKMFGMTSVLIAYSNF